jgi:hypothetical protein
MDMEEVDLSRLIGGNAFTLPCTISKNGYGVKSFSLIDTGANGYAFIDSRFIGKVSERLPDVKLEPLPIPCGVRGFDGKQGTPITHFVRLTLDIDGRHLTRIPFLVVGLGEHDMILGRKWASHRGLLIDCKRRALI